MKYDFDKMTIADLALVLSLSDETTAKSVLPQIIEMLDKIVEGGVKQLPASQLTSLLVDFSQKFAEWSNPKAPAA